MRDLNPSWTMDPPLDFVKLPKIELHAHFTGSISRQCLHSLWKAKHGRGQTTLADPMEVMPEGKHDYNLKTFFPLFSSYIYQLLDDEPSLTRAMTSVLESFRADGVVYLELRTTPRAMPSAAISRADYVAILLRAITASETSSSSSSSSSGLHTRLILSIDRRHSLAEAHEIALLAGSFSPRVVGIDLCGDPAAKPSGEVAVFTPAVVAARAAGLKVTVHFAEAECSASKAELETLLSWRPERLGHVICVSPEVRAEIAAREGIGLELCLSCNVHAGMVAGGFEGHHFGEWRRVKGPVLTLGTDDVGIFGSPLSNEYRLVSEHFKLSRDEVCHLARRGIDIIFAGEDEKERLRGIMWKSAETG